MRKGLDVLVGEELGIDVAAVDGVEDLEDGSRLALGPQDRRLGLPLCPEDSGLLLALGRQNGGLLDALGREDRGAQAPAGKGSAHSGAALDGARRIDGLQLDARNANAPAAGRLVELAAQLAVDLVAPRERLLHVHRADDVSKRRDGELLDGGHRVGDLIGRGDRIRHLIVDDGVDGDVDVVRGDDRLRREGNDLLAHVDPLPNGIDEREQEVQTRRKGLVVPAQALDDVGVPLVDHLDRHEDEKDHDECNQGQKYETDIHIVHSGSF